MNEWRPNPKQSEFLSASEDEVLFGGAAGGGKSDALVIDALGLAHKSILWPKYRALVIRQTTPQLRELIDRTRVIYPAVCDGAVYSEQAKEWRFPSGAKIIFGYCERDPDVLQYQGQEFQWIGIDELSHFPSPYVYEYLSSRLRTTDPNYPCYQRATCNPGPKWIRERFGFSPAGEASCVETKINGRTFTRRFIPSRIDDNRWLADSGYKERLMQLPPQERAALLEGRWDVMDIPGSIYREQMDEVQPRITTVPYDPSTPVNTYWDLGVGDSTAIWFMQNCGREWHAIDYYEASGEGLPHYASVLAAKPYDYGEHWAPHDIRVRELGSGLSRLEVAATYGIRFRITPNIGIEDGIHAARMVFPMVWFDKNKCDAGLDALKHYRRDYNQRIGEFKTSPVHDWSSHASDAFRYFAVASKRNQAPTTFAQPKMAIV